MMNMKEIKNFKIKKRHLRETLSKEVVSLVYIILELW